MQLTHHSTPSRSFIVLIVIVLCTVYAALVLTRINRLYVDDAQTTQPEPINNVEAPTLEAVTELDTTDWEEFADKTYPLTIKIPDGWDTTTSDDLENLYLISITQDDPEALIRIFIAKEKPAEIGFLQSRNFTSKLNYSGTNYDNMIYHIKAGELYYTFDGTAAPDYAAELAAIVNSAKLE